MFDPDWDEGCPSCSAVADNIGHLAHLHAREHHAGDGLPGAAAEAREYRERMGWTVPWVSSYGSDFNYDFHTTIDPSVTPAEYNYAPAAGDEVARKRGGARDQRLLPGRPGGVPRLFLLRPGRGGSWSAPTTTWTSPRSVGRKTGSSPPAAATARPCPGCAATTNTTKPTPPESHRPSRRRRPRRRTRDSFRVDRYECARIAVKRPRITARSVHSSRSSGGLSTICRQRWRHWCEKWVCEPAPKSGRAAGMPCRAGAKPR